MRPHPMLARNWNWKFWKPDDRVLPYLPGQEEAVPRLPMLDKRTRNVVWLMVLLCIIGILTIMVCMPVLAFTPEGLYSEDGWFNFISDGFRKHGWQAIVIFTTSEACIALVRVAGILLYVDIDKPDRKWSTTVCVLLLPVTMIGSVMTMQINDAPDYHIIYAGIWISSSALFHLFVTTAFNSHFRRATIWPVWVLSTVLVLGSIGTGIAFGIGARTMMESRENRLHTGILEYITAEALALNDLLLAVTVLRHLGAK